MLVLSGATIIVGLIPLIKPLLFPSSGGDKEVFLVLGGGILNRERYAFFIHSGSSRQKGKGSSDIPIWISSSGLPEDTILADAKKFKIPQHLLYLDYSATDTLTNFTTLAERLKHEGIGTVNVITDEVHMPRAQMIGSIVLNHLGITMKKIEIPLKGVHSESRIKIFVDYMRCVLWFYTGLDANPLR